jgi:formate dehydrogenase iron-sulfur subunit
MKLTLFLSQDSAAQACGASSVATRLQEEADRRGIDLSLIRVGSRGMVWLEPLLEVQTGQGRKAFGPVAQEDVPSLFDCGFEYHPLAQGLTEDIPYLKHQERLTFARVGITQPTSIEDYAAHGGFQGLSAVLRLSPEEAVRQLTDSGLRGRGGAAFPTGIKWETVRLQKAAQKYIVCNADEGDSGTFSDRMLMEGDPFLLIEGMAIAGLTVGASLGYLYVRSEYPHAIRVLNQAIAHARDHGLLGPSVLGSGRPFDLMLRVGAGSYVCGEETALLESIEGRRGIVRAKPPVPALSGLFGKPTVINNVITFASVPIIFSKGADFYRDFGMGRSRGTLPIQLAGNIRFGGLVEKAFGVSLRDLLYGFGGGTASGRPIRAVQVGGPLGAYLPESEFDVPLDYEALLALGGTLGHGGIVVFDDTVDMARQARWAMEFCAIESCGKCTPCRIGSVRGKELLDDVIEGQAPEEKILLLRDLCDVMVSGSLCAMGGMTPYPVLSALNHFSEDFTSREQAPR